jgi:TonB family protein
MTTQMWLENLAAYSLQVAVLILAGTALVYTFRLKTPVVLMTLWQALLVVCLLLPVIQPWHHLRQTMPSATPPAVLMSIPSAIFPDTEILSPAPSTSPARRLQFPTYTIIASALGIGAVLRFLWLVLGMLRLHRYRNKSRRLAALPDVIREVQWQVGVSPEIFLSREVDTPVTFGFRKPAVLFPESFTAMAENLQRPIACHELLHVQRQDWLLIVLEEILRSFLWFHPAIWWVLGRINLSREQVVDREVLRVTGERDHYLESLLHIASLRGRLAAVPAPLLLKEGHLVQRVALMIKESKMSRSRLVFSLVAIAALLLCTGTFAAAWFPLAGAPHDASPAAAPPSVSASAPAPAAAGTPVSTTPVARKSIRTEGSIVQEDQRKPVRVGSGVQESKLIYRVEPNYPALAERTHVVGTVIVEVSVNEEGSVSNVRVLQGNQLFEQAAIDAVKQWRYSPTYLNGVAVPVVATAALQFGPSNPATQVFLDAQGLLKDGEGNPVSVEELASDNSPIRLTIALSVAGATVEKAIQTVRDRGFDMKNLQVSSPCYSFVDGRLFYRTSLPDSRTPSSPQTFADPSFQPPVLDIDLDRLAAIAKASGRIQAHQLPTGVILGMGLYFTIRLSEKGEILSVQRNSMDIPEVVAALGQIRVLAPGRCRNEFVPTEVSVMLDIRW